MCNGGMNGQSMVKINCFTRVSTAEGFRKTDCERHGNVGHSSWDDEEAVLGVGVKMS